MAAASQGQSQIIIFILVLLIIVVLRLRNVLRGTRVTVSRTIGFSIYYVAFSAFFIATSYFAGVSSIYFVLYFLFSFAAAIFSYRISKNMLVFWKSEDGTIFSKGGLPIYLSYIAGLILRLAIGYIFIGPNAFEFSFSATVSGTALVATVITDIILVIGAGLLVGRNMRILTRFRNIRAGKESLAAPKEK